MLIQVDKIRELRLAAGLSQTELAERAGLSHSLVSKIERGAHRNVTVGTLETIGKVLLEGGSTTKAARCGSQAA